MPRNWTHTELDERISRELQNHLPERVFDIHAHLYRKGDLDGVAGDSVQAQGPADVTFGVWREHIERLFGPSRCTGGLFFPLPPLQSNRVDPANDFLIHELGAHPDSRGLILIYPGYPEGRASEYLAHDQIVGFKVYHTFSPSKPTFEATIDSFMPEWAWRLANEKGLIVVLHLVKKNALADVGNQRYLLKMCRAHPDAKLVLAHAGRGFHAPHTVAGLPALRGLENVWFDTSAICEPTALTAILKQFGPRRLMLGTDFPISEIRGKSVTLGDGFAWLQPDTALWERFSPRCEPTRVGLESLRAVRQAIKDVGLNRENILDIYCDNALRLLGMKRDPKPAARSRQRHAG